MQWIGLAAWGYAAACAVWGLRTGRVSARAIRGAALALLLGSMGVTSALVLLEGMDWVQTLLPLHLCSACAMACVFFYARPTGWMFEFLFFVGMPGAALALCFPAVAVSRWQDAMNACFFLTHALVVFAPVLHIAAGERPNPAHALRAYGVLVLYAAAVLAVNVLLGTNYLFLMAAPAGTPLMGLWQLGRGAYYAALALLALLVVLLQREIARRMQGRPAREGAAVTPRR